MVGKRCSSEDRKSMKSRMEEGSRIMGNTKGSLEVPGDEIKVKLVRVIVFFSSYIQMHWCWCGVGGELA